MNGSETKITLPAGFLLGAAGSAHQTEGNNTNSDWWHYEHQERLPKSGMACDHYNRFDEDFSLAESIGLNAMRISIEWARIEPTEGVWDHAAIAHYRSVLASMKSHGLTRIVTLQHFTLPQWLAAKGGFLHPDSAQLFARYTRYIAAELGSEIDYWVTINEPEIYPYMAYVAGLHPPFKKNVWLYIKLTLRLITAHKAAYHAIKSVKPAAQISIAKNNVYYEPYRKDNFLDIVLVWGFKKFGNYYILDRIKNEIDYIGLNYYFYHTLKFDITKGARHMNETVGPRSDMGWRTYPGGLYHLLLDLKKYGKPVIITENGIANARDDMRQRFIAEHLQSVSQAIQDGVNIKGYCYWSLTDNYEWHDGFDPKFGLIEINYETQKRMVRPSANIFRKLKSG